MALEKPKLHPRVKFSVIKNEGLIISQEKGEVHIVNEVASFLLPLMDGSHTIEELVRKVADEFEVDSATAREDLLTFLEELTSFGVITE